VPDPRNIDFVLGFHPISPTPPPEALAAGLVNRVAAVLSSFRASSPDQFFDAALWCACLDAVSAVTGSTNGELIAEQRRSLLDRLLRRHPERVQGSLKDARAILRQATDPSDKVRWYSGPFLVAVGVAERWDLVGGPLPYHDSYTLSCFISPSHAGPLAAALQTAAIGEGAEVGQIIAASPTPSAA